MMGLCTANVVSVLLMVNALCIIIGIGEECSEEWEVRLGEKQTYSDGKVRGRVEICINEEWGTVCGMDVRVLLPAFGVLESRVACRQLGFDCKWIYISLFYIPDNKATVFNIFTVIHEQSAVL